MTMMMMSECHHRFPQPQPQAHPRILLDYSSIKYRTESADKYWSPLWLRCGLFGDFIPCLSPLHSTWLPISPYICVLISQIPHFHSLSHFISFHSSLVSRAYIFSMHICHCFVSLSVLNEHFFFHFPSLYICISIFPDAWCAKIIYYFSISIKSVCDVSNNERIINNKVQVSFWPGLPSTKRNY